MGNTFIVAGGQIDKQTNVPIVNVAEETEEEGDGEEENCDEDTTVLDDEAITEGFVREIVASFVGLQHLFDGGFFITSAATAAGAAAPFFFGLLYILHHVCRR